MRILHVSDVYLPRLGGIELHVSDLARRQRLAGDEATVVTATPGPEEEGLLRLAGASGSTDVLDRLVEELEVDVVHAHSSLVSPLAWAGARAAARHGVRAVVTMHSLWPVGPAGRVLATALRGVPAATTWTAVSTVAADLLAAALPGRVVGVLPNAVDPADWAPSRSSDVGRTPLLVSVGRTATRKRPLALLRVLEAVRRLVPDDQPLQALLVGEGPLDPLVRRRLRRSNLSGWVRTTGRLDRSAIRRVLARADLYLAPARQESFGIAALEARYAGLPVIGWDGTGLADFVRPGLDGHLVGSDHEMATRVAALVRDPGLLDELRRTARAADLGLDWSTVLARHRAVYEGGDLRRAPARTGVPAVVGDVV